MKWSICSLLFLSGCQSPKPTLVTTNQTAVFAQEENLRSLLSADTLIVDTRREFDFGLNQIPGSINLRFEDLKAPSKGEKFLALDRDLYKLARRLALKGLEPQREILLLGEGDLTSTMALAWALRRLGIEKVKTASYLGFRAQVPDPGSLGPQNRSPWKPAEDSDWEIDYAEFYSVLETQGKNGILKTPPRRKGQPVGRRLLSQNTSVLVFGKRDFLGALRVKDIQSYWSQSGQIRSELRAEVESLGLKKEDQILVVSEDFLTSAAATFSLREMGFQKARALNENLDPLLKTP